MLKRYLPILCVLFFKLTVISGISSGVRETTTADSSGNLGHCASMVEGTSRTASTICQDWGIDEYIEPVFTINGHAVTVPSLSNRRNDTGHKKQLCSNNFTEPDPVAHVPVQVSYRKIPLYFIQNNGQMDDRVKFYEKGKGHAMYFTEDGVYLSLVSKGQETKEKGRNRETENKGGGALSTVMAGSEPLSLLNPDVYATGEESSLRKGEKWCCENQQPIVVKLVPLAANKHPEIVAEGLQKGKINYFIGNNPEEWRTNIPTYGAVVYKEIYKGIDIKFYGNNCQLEYDIIVKPWADPSQVRFAYEGIDDLKVNEDGDLEIIIKNRSNYSDRLNGLIGLNGFNGIPNCLTTEQKIIQKRPYVYQEIDGKRVEVKGEFRVMSSGFVVEERAAETLSTRHKIRNAKHEIRNRQPKVLNPHSAICNQQFMYGFAVATYDTARTLIIDPTISYSTYIGGNGEDLGLGIAVDSSGNAYITGETNSTNFPLVGTNTAYAGDIDAFVTKLGTSGASVAYSTYIGGSGADKGRGIAVDSSGNVYITGDTKSTNFPIVGTTTAYGGGDYDVFVTKLSASGADIEYSTYIGGTYTDRGYGIAVIESGSAYITGSTQSGNFPVVGTTTVKNNGTSTTDVFVTKLGTGTSNLQIVYSTYIGGNNGDSGAGIAVDSAGSAYITGLTQSGDFPRAGTTTANSGGVEAFVAKLGTDTSNLQMVYSTYIGGSGDENGYGIAVDSPGSAYVTGFTYSSNFPVVGTTTGKNNGTSSPDVFVAKLGTNTSPLKFIYSTYIGGSNFDQGYGIAVDSAGSAYIIGETRSTDFPIVGTTTGKNNGDSTSDVFVAKLSASGASIAYSTYIGGGAADKGNGIAVDSSGYVYITGETKSGIPIVGTTTAYGGGNYDAFVTKFDSTLVVNGGGGDGGGGWEPPDESLSISSTSPSNGATGVSVTTAVSAPLTCT